MDRDPRRMDRDPRRMDHQLILDRLLAAQAGDVEGCARSLGGVKYRSYRRCLRVCQLAKKALTSLLRLVVRMSRTSNAKHAGALVLLKLF